MKKLVSTLKLDKKEWLKYRKQGIGGSDAGAVCGLNPYRTAMQVYQDKVSEEIEEIDNEAMRQGREFEDYVARRFMEETGKKVRRANAMFYHEKYPFMLADVDRMVVGENAGLECKTASPYMADKWEDGKIPLSYQIQCYHYMAVCGTDAWYIAEYYKQAVVETIPLTGFNEKLRRRQELSEIIGKMDTEKRQIEQELKLYLGEAEIAENEQYRVSWKAVESNRLDEKRLKEEQPEIYEKYKKSVLSRRFSVKAA